MPRLIFWQNIPSFYQAPHVTALAELPGYEVVWVVRELLTPDRKAQGWSVPDFKKVRMVVGPTDDEIKAVVNERPEESVHIFSGIHQWPLARRGFHLCVKTTAQIGLLNEPPIPGSFLRNIAIRPYHLIHTLIYGRRISFVMAIGHMAVAFYKSIGYPPNHVFPYGYFPDVAAPPKLESEHTGPIKLMYLGQLIHRKGIDVLLSALSSLKDLDWTLRIVGNGEDEALLKQMAADLKLADRVSFSPPAPNAVALALIGESDVFILPSRHDGWGVVVNEALLCGVPVICSDHCGATDLLQDEWRGSSFQVGSTEDLARKLSTWIKRGPRTPEQAEAIQEWCARISGASAAKYLAAAAKYTAKGSSESRPEPPWFH